MNNILPEKSDKELVSMALQNKDYVVFIISRYEERLRRYIRRISNTDELEDILQNTFIKMYEYLAGFDQSLSFSSWIYRIAHNETISYYRKRKKEVYLEDEELFNNLRSEINISEERERSDLSKEIAKAVNLLNDKYKDILILRYFEDKSYEEISDILQISPGTVATHINRAKKKIKDYLLTNKKYE